MKAVVLKVLATAGLSAVSPAITAGQCRTLRVAAASDLQFVMPALVAEFEKSGSRKPVDVTYGSSGNFFAQIQNGAPFELFFSADVDYARKLSDDKRAIPGTLYEYATGRIVVWAPSGTTPGLRTMPWQTLTSAAIHKIAIANPQHAPYGRAAVAALKSAGIYEQVKNKLVFGENISQAAQFVQSGNAAAGILALSLALSPAMASGERWEIPGQMYPPIAQAVVRLDSKCRPEAAEDFLAFVKSAAAKHLLYKSGFGAPASN